MDQECFLAVDDVLVFGVPNLGRVYIQIPIHLQGLVNLVAGPKTPCIVNLASLADTTIQINAGQKILEMKLLEEDGKALVCRRINA
jgi:hypothetical protein